MLRTLPSLLLLPLCAAATYAHMHNAWPLNDVGSILTRDPLCSLVCCARAAAVYDWQCLKSICCLFSALCAHKSTHNIICYAACCLCMDMSSLCVLSSVIFFFFFFPNVFALMLCESPFCCAFILLSLPSAGPFHEWKYTSAYNIVVGSVFLFFFLLSCAG